MQIMQLPPIDQNSVEDIQHRIVEFYQLCADNDFKPLVSSYANALGWNVGQLYGVMRRDPNYSQLWENLSADVIKSVERGYEVLSQMWEAYMQNGKINPVSGIFLGKNQFGYQDKVEHTVQVKQDLSEQQLLERYEQLKLENKD